jgi:hypothetical protein
MQEPRQRTSEELQELRRQGLAAHSPIATRLIVLAGVLICLVVVLRDTRVDAGVVLNTDFLLVLLRTVIASTAAVTLILGLLSPLVQRKGLLTVGLLTPRWRWFPDRVPLIRVLLSFIVALLVAAYLGYRFAGAIFSLGVLAISVPLEQLGALIESEALWLTGFATVFALIAAVAAHQRFVRGGDAGSQ